MSKSQGNTVDPLQWIEDYGADAVRFTLARGVESRAPTRRSPPSGSPARRKFCSKLFNATRFALLNGATVPDGPTRRRAR